MCNQKQQIKFKNNKTHNIMIKIILFLLLTISTVSCQGPEVKWLSHNPKNPNNDQLVYIIATAYDRDKISKIEIYLTEYEVIKDEYCILNKCSTHEKPEPTRKNIKIKECRFSAKSKEESCVAEVGPFSESSYIGYKMIAYDSRNYSTAEGYYYFETGGETESMQTITLNTTGSKKA